MEETPWKDFSLEEQAEDDTVNFLFALAHPDVFLSQVPANLG